MRLKAAGSENAGCQHRLGGFAKGGCELGESLRFLALAGLKNSDLL